MQKYLSSIDILSENLRLAICVSHWRVTGEPVTSVWDCSRVCSLTRKRPESSFASLLLSWTFQLLECLIHIYWQNDFVFSIVLQCFFFFISDSDVFTYSVVILTCPHQLNTVHQKKIIKKALLRHSCTWVIFVASRCKPRRSRYLS